MSNIEERNGRFRAQVYRRRVRATKTFGSLREAETWVAEQKRIIASTGRLSLVETGRRRVDYGAVTFSPTRSEGLLSEQAILAAAQPYQKVCGVYFLIAGHRIMYVGQSTDAHYRAGYHAASLGRVFDAVHVIPCDERDACLLESRYIMALQPPWNRRRDGTLNLSVTKHAITA